MKNSSAGVSINHAISAAICTFALAGFVSATALIASSSTAVAKVEFSQQTKLPCGQCHTNPAGGGALKSFGAKFKANGFKVK